VQVKLKGQVELLDPSFQLSLAPKSPASSMTLAERNSVNAMLAEVRKQDNLRLRVGYASSLAGSGSKKHPRFLTELRALLSHSGLDSSRWRMAPAELSGDFGSPEASPAQPPPAPQLKSSTTATPEPLRCGLKVFQDF